MVFLRSASSAAVIPAGRMTAFQPSTYSLVYLWPWPAGTPVANGRSAVTCQKVTKGIQNMPLSTSLPGGSLIQSGSLKIRCGQGCAQGHVLDALRDLLAGHRRP